jgi:hypothetical protein
MTATVTSKFRNSLWISPFLLGILVSGLIAICVAPGNAYMVPGTLAVLIILICFNTYRAVNRFIKVEVSPDSLLLHYLLINKQISVNYADMVHVSIVRNTSDYYETSRRFTLADTTKLKIELNNGKKLYLVEEYYENFDELKEAVRRARFGLD